jgi:antitoxin component of MazEF toxin-antitoxin module
MRIGAEDTVAKVDKLLIKHEDRITVKRRKIVGIGGSFYIVLPRSFISKHRLHRGSEVAVVANDKVQIVVP